MGLVSKRLNKLVNSEVNANGSISDNQIECAKNVLYSFDGEYPKSNYVIIKGQTQAGKTGVLYALSNIINREELKVTLGLKRIMYITGDNSKDLVRQQEDRSKNDIMDFRAEDIKPMFMKRSDFKNYMKKETSIDGTIIFIDESHFGTTKKTNQLPKFLKHYGIDYLKNTNLEEHNIRIISNTATPYCELASDKVQNKLTVLLKPSEGYIGILDFTNNVIPLSRNVFDRTIVDKALPNILDATYNHLKEIEETKGKVKCAIFRACGKNDLPNLRKYASDKFDIYQFDTSKGIGLDYEHLWDKIDTYCGLGKLRSEGKYLMVVVKDALRMGISVRDRKDNNQTKNCIGILYDYPSDKDKPEVTEQGLLGRMCGYREKGDTEWTDIRFYLNETHWYTLKNAYEKGLLDENGRIKELELTKRNVVKERLSTIDELISEYDAKQQNLDIEKLEKEGMLYHIDVGDSNDFYYQYDATSFYFSKIGTSFGGFSSFTLKDLKTPRIQFTDLFIKPFLESVDEHYAKDNYIQKGCRRCGIGVGENEKAFIDTLKNPDKPMTISSAAYPFPPQNIGKYAWQALLNMDEMEDPYEPKIYVSVKIAQMNPYKYNVVFSERGSVDTADTMVTD